MSESNEDNSLPSRSESAVTVAAAMLRRGMPYREIAEELHTSSADVYRAIRTRFKQEAQFLADEEREMLLMIENERFDYMLNKLWPEIEYGDHNAIRLALAISDRRLKWNHMDQPTSTSTTQVLVVGGESQNYIERLKELTDG